MSDKFVYDEYLHRIRTPLETINILGVGGIKMGTLCELWGPPGGGKTTFAYGCAGFFQEDYPNGFLDVLDAENSVDDIRLTRVFKIDVNHPNYKVHPAPTVESAFKIIAARSAEAKAAGQPYLCIIDSWTVLNTESGMNNLAEIQKNPEKAEFNMYSGGQMQKPRVGRDALNRLMPLAYRSPMTILIINQATTEITRFGSTITSGGGYGLKHDIQFAVYFEKGKLVNEIPENPHSKVLYTTSVAEITKSKFIPEIKDIKTFIDIANGGIYLPHFELLNLYKDKGLFDPSPQGWYLLKGTDVKRRWKDLETDLSIDPLLIEQIANKYRSEYFLVNCTYEEKARRLELLKPVST